MKYFGKKLYVTKNSFHTTDRNIVSSKIIILVQFSFVTRKGLQSWMDNQLSQSSLILFFDLKQAFQLKDGSLKKFRSQAVMSNLSYSPLSGFLSIL